MHLSIGDLARRTGLPVKTIRFYSDQGLVPPVARSPAGYRRYDLAAVARAELIRTLRELGLDLATIRTVVDRPASLAEVAGAHAEALAVQIQTLRLRRAVLTAVAARGASAEEMTLMHRLARLSAAERRNLIDEFLGTVFGGLGDDPGFAGIVRTMTPELPDNPDTEQVEAWVELAELSADPEFRAGLRRMAEQHAADREPGEVPRPDPVAVVREAAGAAVAAGVDPAGPAAEPIVAAVLARYAETTGRPDGAALRRRLLTRLRTAADPRRDRYLELLSVVNGWPAGNDGVAPVLDWFVAALRARSPGLDGPARPEPGGSDLGGSELSGSDLGGSELGGSELGGSDLGGAEHPG